MKFMMLSLLLLTLMWQTPEPSQEVSLDEEFTIKIGQHVQVKDTNLKITFTSVAEDSRCPVDVSCVWAGNARLNMEVKKGRKKFAAVFLNTTLNPGEIIFKGYRVKLIKLNPQPKAGIPMDPGTYEATFIVSNK